MQIERGEGKDRREKDKDWLGTARIDVEDKDGGGDKEGWLSVF